MINQFQGWLTAPPKIDYNTITMDTKPCIDSLKTEWDKQQQELKKRLRIIPEDAPRFEHIGNRANLLVVGMDISFLKHTDSRGHTPAVCTAVFMNYDHLSDPAWKLVDSVTREVTITEPYIAGYLAFREVNHYVDTYYALLEKIGPDEAPNLIMVDGNGILHPKQFGLASHLGVLLNKPTMGAAKALHHVDGLDKKTVRAQLEASGENCLELVGQSGTHYGYAMKGRNNTNPVYLSPGHLVSLSSVKAVGESAICTREPEPTRMADRLSREWIRNNLR